uniref:Uncharacterized protein n=1 Tax=Manihot esculenta TaxID=3983 RepID=A0A2C9WAD5_MANES
MRTSLEAKKRGHGIAAKRKRVKGRGKRRVGGPIGSLF